MRALFLMLLGVGMGQHALQDGVPVSDKIEQVDGGEILYTFQIKDNVENQDLSVTVTTFSDLSDPDLYLSRDSIPSIGNHMWQSVAWGSGAILLRDTEVQPGTYNALVTCKGPCAFDIAYSYVNETQLRLGIPQIGTISKDRTAVLAFEFPTDVDLPASLTFTVTPYDPTAQLQISVRADSLPTLEDSLPLHSLWPVGFGCVVTDIRPNTLYRVLILALSDFTYEATVLKPGQELALQPSVPVRGIAGPASFTYYRVSIGQHARFVKVQLTKFAGDPRILVKYDSPPLLDDYTYTSHWSNETVFIRPNDVRIGELYIGVYSTSEAAYTIYVMTNPGSWVPLYPGLPQGDVVDNMHIAYAFLDMSNGLSRNITFRVSPTHGDPNLFVQLCHSPDYHSCAFVEDAFHHPENYNVYSSRHSEGDDYIMIPHNGASCTHSFCRYVVAVANQGPTHGARYVLSATFDEQDHYNLMHDVPVRMTLQKQGYLYYQYTAFSPEADSITFQLTPIIGDPDLYISRSVVRPSNTDFEKSSTLSSLFTDVVTYRREIDGVTLTGTYHIAVYSWAATTFSLVVHEAVPDRNTTIRLSQGQPQQGIVYQNTPGHAETDYRLYMFEVSFPMDFWPSITVSLTILTGQEKMYIANNIDGLNLEKDTFYYDWCTCFTNSTGVASTITIPATDPLYRANTTYLVLVQGEEFADDGSASFTVSYSIEGSMVYLQEGIPYFDQVARDRYNYYQFPLATDYEDVTFQLNALVGDPDLYILINSADTYPSKTNSHYNSTTYGSSTLTLQWEQIKTYCPAVENDAGFGQLHGCHIYIAVYGYIEATYNVRVSSRRSLPVFLPLGESTAGYLNGTEYAYYYTPIASTDIDGIAVHLQSLEGDADLYVNLVSQVSGGDRSEWRRPNKDSSDFQSRSAVFGDYVGISPADIREKCRDGSCVVLAGAYCFSGNCRYMMMISSDNVLSVAEGVPVFGNLDAGDYVYYKFYNSKDTTAILITLTPLSVGDPDLFIDYGTDTRPTVSNSTWRSTSWRGEELLINSTDEAFTHIGTMRGYYIIGVRGFSNCTYSLTVTTNPQPVLQLVSGIPMQGDLSPWSVRYYSYFNYQSAELIFTLTPLFGLALLRINVFRTYTGELYSHLPQRNSSIWSSTASGTQNRLIITPNDANFCLDCTYVIGVFTEQGNCSFSVSAAAGEEAVILQNGIPMLGQVSPNGWKYYVFYLWAYSDLDISVVVYSGDADLYVNTNFTVTKETALWSKATTRHVEHLSISKSDSHFAYGQYNIGVYGKRNSSYSITAHARDSRIVLIDGWPQSYSIMQVSEDHLMFEYYTGSDGSDMVSCQLRRQEPNFWPRVFVTFMEFTGNNTTFVPPPGPSPTSSQFSYSRSDYDQVYGTLTFSLPGKPIPGEYLLAVYGMSQSSPVTEEEVGTFELSCSGQTNSTILLMGRTEYGVLSSPQQKQRFQIYISEPGLLQVSAIPCSGRLSMSISSNYTTEENSGADVVVSRVVDGKIQAEIVNAMGQYYVTLKMLQPADEEFGTSYQLSYEFYPQGMKRPKKVIPGDEGRILWQAEGRENVKLTWSGPEYEDGDSINGVIYYLIYISNDTQAKMNTVCGMRTGEERHMVWVENSGYTNETAAVVHIPPGHPHVINIVSVIFTSSGMSHLPYSPTEVYLRKPHGRRRVGMLLIGGITAVLVVALVGLFVLWKKYRRVKRTLENEMQDVRNVANISSDRLGDEEFKSKQASAIYQPLEVAKD